MQTQPPECEVRPLGTPRAREYLGLTPVLPDSKFTAAFCPQAHRMAGGVEVTHLYPALKGLSWCLWVGGIKGQRRVWVCVGRLAAGGRGVRVSLDKEDPVAAS